MSDLISSLAWVRRGAAAPSPSKYVLDETELERIARIARIELQDARGELERAHKAAESMGKGFRSDDMDDDDEDGWVDEDGDVDMEEETSTKTMPKDDGDELAKYKLDEYDNEEAEEAPGLFSNIKGLTYYRNNDDDPHITLKEEDEQEEKSALEIQTTDNLIVTAKTEDEISQLEIYVYDESEENLYVHHDLMLPNFPLCLEWLGFPLSSTSSSPAREFGNYVAVGTLDPEIEIWSLDVVEAIYPDTVLGRPDKSAAHVPVPAGTGKKKKKKLKRRAINDEYHVDAVLGLSWNKGQPNLLASASADHTVKVWDLTHHTEQQQEEAGEVKAMRSFNSLHTDKVQAVRWNPTEHNVLLTGSYDRTIRMVDLRAPDQGVGAVLGSDVEALRWDLWDPHTFYVSVENGHIFAFDGRSLSSNHRSQVCPATFTIAAHDGPASALDVNPHIRGCLLSGGGDKLVKIWNINETGGKRSVSLATSRDLGVGKVFSASFSPDDPLTLAAAGSAAKLQIWDIGASQQVRKIFGARLREAGKAVKEREAANGGVIGLVDDDEESDKE